MTAPKSQGRQDTLLLHVTTHAASRDRVSIAVSTAAHHPGSLHSLALVTNHFCTNSSSCTIFMDGGPAMDKRFLGTT